MSQAENSLTGAVLALLSAKGFLVWRQNNAAVFNRARNCYVFHGLKGVADVLALDLDGTFWAIEVKSAKGKQSPDQRAFQECVEHRNGVYVLSRSIDDVIRELDRRAKP